MTDTRRTYTCATRRRVHETWDNRAMRDNERRGEVSGQGQDNADGHHADAIRNEDLFSALVIPISKFGPGKNGDPEPIGAVGTGFTFGEGTVVTCWHCVRGPLGKGEFYAAVARTGGTDQQTYDQWFRLDELEQDANGSDLALARIEATVSIGLHLAAGPAGWGDDVMACGYPLPLNTKDVETREPRINTNAMLFKGYVMRIRLSDFPGQPEGRVYELDMHAPPGMSGAPVLRAGSREVVGVVVDERGYVIETDELSDNDRTITIPLDRKLYFAYAHHLEVLSAAKGAATDGLPLAEFLAKDPSE